MALVVLSVLSGVVQGARHALEPDHVTAVATVMVEAPSPRRGVFYAACWGLGHALMLLLVAGPLVTLNVRLPEAMTSALEVAVGAMLVYLGLAALRRRQSAAPPPEHAPLVVRGRRPFAIGVVHGLAGSGALAALIALGAPTVRAGLASLVLYAFGTVVGMVGLATAVGPVLGRATQLPKVARVLTTTAGCASIALGLFWGYASLLGK